jgi:hypothetical protein
MSLTSQQNQMSGAMRVGQTAYVCVYAHKRWNDSGLDVVSGQVFNFAVPDGEKWLHSRRKCGPDGYLSTVLTRPWEIFRRVPTAGWLQLIGSIGRSGTPLLIGARLLEFLPPFSGRLYFFANHLPWMYWNNYGMIAIRVTRTR